MVESPEEGHVSFTEVCTEGLQTFQIYLALTILSPLLLVQVHPVVSRLCAPIEGTDAARLADCLGLDVSKYRGSSSGEATADELREEALLASAVSLDDDALYKVKLKLARQGGFRKGGSRNE